MRDMMKPIAGPNAPMSDWIMSHFPKGFRGTCLDIGAADGFSVSSTFTLEARHGWKVLCVEPNPYFEAPLRARRGMVKMCAASRTPGDDADFLINLPNPEAFSALVVKEDALPASQKHFLWSNIRVKTRTVEQLLAEFNLVRLDAICIDTEGTERDVLESFDIEKWFPVVIVVESWNEGALDDYLIPFGYEKSRRVGDDDCYVRRSL